MEEKCIVKSFMACIPYKCRTMKWAGNVAHTDQKRTTARFWMRKSEEKIAWKT
jgi:hypothetical protein